MERGHTGAGEEEIRRCAHALPGDDEPVPERKRVKVCRVVRQEEGDDAAPESEPEGGHHRRHRDHDHRPTRVDPPQPEERDRPF